MIADLLQKVIEHQPYATNVLSERPNVALVKQAYNLAIVARIWSTPDIRKDDSQQG